MKAQIKDIADVCCVDDTVEFTVVLDSWYRQDVYNAVKAISGDNTPYILTIEKQKKKRSLNANAYCWTLCQKIAEKVGATKETVYRKNIEEVGSFTVMELADEAVQRFIEVWQGNGIGYIAEPCGKGTSKGFMNVIAYHGSSAYNTKEMSRLIDALVEEAKSLVLKLCPTGNLKGW